MNRILIEEEQENDIDIEPVPDGGRLAEPMEAEDNPDVQGEEVPMYTTREGPEDPKIAALRSELKKILAMNPGITLPDYNENLRLVDIIPAEQVEAIYQLTLQSINKGLDENFAHAAIDMVCTALPGVDSEKLKSQIKADTMFVDGVKTFLGMKLSALPVPVKLFILGAIHLFPHFKLPNKRKADALPLEGEPGQKQR